MTRETFFPYMRPADFAKRHRLPAEFMRVVIYYREINGLADAKVTKTFTLAGKPTTYVHHDRMLQWLKATQQQFVPSASETEILRPDRGTTA